MVREIFNIEVIATDQLPHIHSFADHYNWCIDSQTWTFQHVNKVEQEKSPDRCNCNCDSTCKEKKSFVRHECWQMVLSITRGVGRPGCTDSSIGDGMLRLRWKLLKYTRDARAPGQRGSVWECWPVTVWPFIYCQATAGASQQQPWFVQRKGNRCVLRISGICFKEWRKKHIVCLAV